MLLSLALLLFAWSGRPAALRELAALKNADVIKNYTLCEMWDVTRIFGVPGYAPGKETAQEWNWSGITPPNPYTGVVIKECGGAGELSPGDFSFLLVKDLRVGDYADDSAIVMYTPAPTLAQRLYYKLFQGEIPPCSPDLSQPGPAVVWIGGECGNCYEFLARGMPPAAAIAEINRFYKATDPENADDVYWELEFQTPEQYATLQSVSANSQAGGLQ